MKTNNKNEDHVTVDAFSRLYEEFAPRVFGYLIRRTPTVLDAEELTSTVFLRAFTALANFRGRGSDAFGGWIMTIAHNSLVNWYRDTGRSTTPELLQDYEDALDNVPSPEHLVEHSEEIQNLWRAVASLSDDRQELITLKYVDGLTNKKIGEKLGKSEGAIKQIHRRTLIALEAILGSY
ncbi:MAG: sigma-70 family RNA polymerase sigma factor [Chloroflexota bacterium]|nr:sigma-70 family RNA polymerase sigma factor [Chloroflexota bacterium]